MFNSKLGGISGTQDRIPIWSSAYALGNSSLTETSSGTLNGSQTVVTTITGTLALT